MTKYFYIRQPNQPSGPPLYGQFINGKPTEIRIMQRGAPVACVAYERRADDDVGEGWDLVTYAFSACNNKEDEFTKFHARILANSRLKYKWTQQLPINQMYGFNVESTTSAAQVVHFILDEISGFSWAPSHVRRAAKNWLNG